MATYMEKDILLEFASVGYLIDDLTDEAKADIVKMGVLHWEILMTEPEKLDFKGTLEKIKSIKAKYERD